MFQHIYEIRGPSDTCHLHRLTVPHLRLEMQSTSPLPRSQIAQLLGSRCSVVVGLRSAALNAPESTWSCISNSRSRHMAAGKHTVADEVTIHLTAHMLYCRVVAMDESKLQELAMEDRVSEGNSVGSRPARRSPICGVRRRRCCHWGCTDNEQVEENIYKYYTICDTCTTNMYSHRTISIVETIDDNSCYALHQSYYYDTGCTREPDTSLSSLRA